MPEDRLPRSFFFSFHPGHNSSFFSFLTRSFFLFFLTRPYFFFLVFVFLPVSSVSLLNIIFTISAFSLLCQVFTFISEEQKILILANPFLFTICCFFFLQTIILQYIFRQFTSSASYALKNLQGGLVYQVINSTLVHQTQLIKKLSTSPI